MYSRKWLPGRCWDRVPLGFMLLLVFCMSSSSLRRRLSSFIISSSRVPHEPAAGQPRVEIIEHDRSDNHAADDDLAVILIDAQDDDAATDHLDNEGAKNRF